MARPKKQAKIFAVTSLHTAKETSMRKQESETEERHFENIGVLLIVIAGILWGTMGIFVRHMESFGLEPLQIVCTRLTVAAICFQILLQKKDAKGRKQARKDYKIFLATGLCSLLVFTWCYFTAISIMEVSVAAILLYTSPIWVMLLSAIVFHEAITKRKLTAVGLAFAGCALISGITGGNVTTVGLLIGLGAGIGYGLYSIFGTIALRTHSTFVVTAYSFSIAAIGAWCLSNPPDLINCYLESQFWYRLGFTVLMGIVTAFLPFLCYTLGLERIAASKAAVLATVEPLVATLVGIIVFRERLTVMAVIGIVCVLGAIVLAQGKEHKEM